MVKAQSQWELSQPVPDYTIAFNQEKTNEMMMSKLEVKMSFNEEWAAKTGSGGAGD